MSRQSKGFAVLRGTRGKSTDKAVQFTITHMGLNEIVPQTTWFPESQIHNSFFDPTQSGADTITVTEWILRQKGLLHLNKPVTGVLLPVALPTSETHLSGGHFDSIDLDDVPF